MLGRPFWAFRFGNCSNGGNDGFFARTFNNVAANAGWNNGASVLSCSGITIQMPPTFLHLRRL